MMEFQQMMELVEYIIRSYEPDDHEDNITDKAVDLIDAYLRDKEGYDD